MAKARPKNRLFILTPIDPTEGKIILDKEHGEEIRLTVSELDNDASTVLNRSERKQLAEALLKTL